MKRRTSHTHYYQLLRRKQAKQFRSRRSVSFSSGTFFTCLSNRLFGGEPMCELFGEETIGNQGSRKPTSSENARSNCPCVMEFCFVWIIVLAQSEADAVASQLPTRVMDMLRYPCRSMGVHTCSNCAWIRRGLDVDPDVV